MIGPINAVVAMTSQPQGLAVTALCTTSDFGTTASSAKGAPNQDGTVQVTTRCGSDSKVSSLGVIVGNPEGRLRALTVGGNGHSGRLVVSHASQDEASFGTVVGLCSN